MKNNTLSEATCWFFHVMVVYTTKRLSMIFNSKTALLLLGSRWKSVLWLSVFLFLLFSSQLSIAQTSSKVEEVYGANYRSELSVQRINYLEFYANNGYEIVEKAVIPDEKFLKLSEVPLQDKKVKFARPVFDANNFNPLKYQFKRNKNLDVAYRVDGTNLIVVLWSETKLAEAYNKSQGK